jgi:hypothetical protein
MSKTMSAELTPACGQAPDTLSILTASDGFEAAVREGAGCPVRGYTGGPLRTVWPAVREESVSDTALTWAWWLSLAWLSPPDPHAETRTQHPTVAVANNRRIT